MITITEIRPIRRSECDRFLTILCDVFDLDYDLAHGVFFADPGFDPARKWALFSGGEMQTILTTTPLLFGSTPAIGIAGVATVPSARGRGLAERLVTEVCAAYEAQGIHEAILFAKRTDLYARCGFEKVDEVVRGPITSHGAPDPMPALPDSKVEQIYQTWSQEHPRRLSRDAFGWARWKFNYRICEPMGLGYGCIEGGIIREAILGTMEESWPVPPGTEWFGLKTLTHEIGVPGVMTPTDLYLMGRHSPSPPRMFMSDQF